MTGMQIIRNWSREARKKGTKIFDCEFRISMFGHHVQFCRPQARDGHLLLGNSAEDGQSRTLLSSVINQRKDSGPGFYVTGMLESLSLSPKLINFLLNTFHI